MGDGSNVDDDHDSTDESENATQDRSETLSDPEKVPDPPQSGDLTEDCVIAELIALSNGFEDPFPLPAPADATHPKSAELLKYLEQTRNRPEGAKDMPFVKVSKEEFRLARKWRPILDLDGGHEGLRGMAQLVIHRKRNENGYAPAPAAAIRAAFGLPPQRGGDRAPSVLLLWLYKVFVDRDFMWSGYKSGHCRHVTNHSTPDRIMDEAQRFFLDRHGETGINFMTGKESDPYLKNQTFDRLKERAREPGDAEIAPPEKTIRIVEYMNGLSKSQMFRTWQNNVQDAVDALKSIAADSSVLYDEGIRQSITMLRRFEDMKWMLYQVGNYTPRPTPVGHNNLVGVDSEALPALLGKKNVALDLSKAQLAMFCHVANRFDRETDQTDYRVPEAEERLHRHLDGSDPFDMWDDLVGTLAFPANNDRLRKAARDAVKRGTYSTVYGAKDSTIQHNICTAYARNGGEYPDSHDPTDGFLEHPMIEQLLDVRKRVKARISRNDGAQDSFGRWLDREDFKRGDDELKEEMAAYDEDDYEGMDVRKGAKGLLAYIVQGVEVETMWPIFESAIAERKREGKDRWRVMQYRYDEVVLWVRDLRRVETWANHVRELVDDYADQNDILTELDIEYAP